MFGDLPGNGLHVVLEAEEQLEDGAGNEECGVVVGGCGHDAVLELEPGRRGARIALVGDDQTFDLVGDVGLYPGRELNGRGRLVDVNMHDHILDKEVVGAVMFGLLGTCFG